MRLTETFFLRKRDRNGRKRHTGMTNRQIGELFGTVSYSAVAKAHEKEDSRQRAAGSSQSVRKGHAKNGANLLSRYFQGEKGTKVLGVNN